MARLSTGRSTSTSLSHRVELVHVTGNENSRQVAQALAEIDALAHLSTSIGVRQVSKWVARSPASDLLRRREFSMVPAGRLRTSPLREVVRNVGQKLPSSRARSITGAGGALSVLWVTRGLDRRLARQLRREHPAAIYGYNDQCTEIARMAAQEGIPLVLELQHVHWKRYRDVVVSEAVRSPDWSSTLLDLSVFNRISWQQDLELTNSSLVISPSRQVTDSVLSVRPDASLASAPYGCPPVSIEARRGRIRAARLKVLYVGRLDATKGIADLNALLEALSDHIDLTVIGARPGGDHPTLDKMLAKARYLGAISRQRVLNEMDDHDLLVLPSLVEGRSLTVLESLSRGLPAIVTPGTGTDDIVEEGGGIVVPNAAPEQLIGAVEDVLQGRHSLSEMSQAAVDSARNHTWARFRSDVVEALSPWLNERVASTETVHE